MCAYAFGRETRSGPGIRGAPGATRVANYIILGAELRSGVTHNLQSDPRTRRAAACICKVCYPYDILVILPDIKTIGWTGGCPSPLRTTLATRSNYKRRGLILNVYHWKLLSSEETPLSRTWTGTPWDPSWRVPMHVPAHQDANKTRPCKLLHGQSYFVRPCIPS